MWILSIMIIKINSTIANGTAAFIKDDFVLNFVGVFLGLAVAVITLLYSNVEKIRESLYKTISDDKVIVDLEMKITEIFKELKHNTIFIFVSLITSFFLIMLRDADIPFVKWNIKNISKIEFFYSLEIVAVLLTFLALLDIIGTLFKLSDASKSFEFIKRNGGIEEPREENVDYKRNAPKHSSKKFVVKKNTK